MAFRKVELTGHRWLLTWRLYDGGTQAEYRQPFILVNPDGSKTPIWPNPRVSIRDTKVIVVDTDGPTPTQKERDAAKPSPDPRFPQAMWELHTIGRKERFNTSDGELQNGDVWEGTLKGKPVVYWRQGEALETDLAENVIIGKRGNVVDTVERKVKIQ